MSKKGIFVLALTLVTLLAWLGFDLYHRRQQTNLPEVPPAATNQVIPQLDAAVLEELEERQQPQLPAELGY